MKPLKMFDEPRLDRAFSDAYEATMRQVERAERERAAQDRVDAFASLFERELEQRDLTPHERRRFVRALKESVGEAHGNATRRARRRRSLALAVGGGTAAAAALSFLIYLGAARPLASIPKIQAELGTLSEKVQEGYGEYASRYYRTLGRYARRLGEGPVSAYERQMHGLLEERFQEALGKVRNGQVAYVDDALKWARRFPEREERTARRQQVQNAALEGVGRKVEETVRSVIGGAKDLVKDAVESIEEGTKR